jgi:hypothetical protein
MARKTRSPSLLLGTGLIGMGARRWRNRRQGK